MIEKIINRNDFLTTKWAGGETTQMIIYPQDAILSQRNFLFRVSSATFTSTESTFSDFSGYQRYILPLEGKLSLHHEGLYSRDLEKYDVEYFDGSWNTSSENSLDCRDFNFVVKSGNPARMRIIYQGDSYVIKNSQIVTLFSMDSFVINFHNHNETREIDGFSLFYLETEQEEKISITRATSPVIVTEFKVFHA